MRKLAGMASIAALGTVSLFASGAKAGDPLHLAPGVSPSSLGYVAMGSDYLETQGGAGGTTFDFCNPGCPTVTTSVGSVTLGTLDFQSLKTTLDGTDTVLQRTYDTPINATNAGNPQSSPLQITYLAMQSSGLVKIGPKFYRVCVMLDPNPPAATPAHDTGTITIYGTTVGGTFDSAIDVYADISFKAASDPISAQCNIPATAGGGFDFSFSQTGGAWTATAGKTVLYPHFDDGSQCSISTWPKVCDLTANSHKGLPANIVDFFFTSLVEHHPVGGQHAVKACQTP